MRPLASTVIGSAEGSRKFHYRADSPGDQGVIEQVFRREEYSIVGAPQAFRVQRAYSEILASGRKPLVLDAGANIGASAVWFARLYPQCRIVAIEPEPNNCSVLRLNTEDLDCHVVEAGLGSQPGRLFLTDPGKSDWGFRLSQQGEVEVAVVSANDLVAVEEAAGAVPFIAKIDIEGGESELFSQHTEWVSLFPLLVVELHDWMLPGTACSRSFFRIIGEGNYDCLNRGEHMFCFNNDLYAGPRPLQRKGADG